MKRLKNEDLQLLISAIADLNADFDPRTLPERAIKAATKAIAADSVAFTGINYDGQLSGLAWDGSEAVSPEALEIFGQFMHEQPLFKAYVVERRTETLKITDLIAAEKFERTDIYNQFYKRVGVRNQLVSPLVISRDLFVSCSANTGKRDFSERQKLMSELLAPHLISAIRNAFAYQRLESALETEACGVISINSAGQTAFVSEYARNLFSEYFADEKRESDALPEIVRNWLNETNTATGEFAMPQPPLVIAGQETELIVRRTYNQTTREITLLLEEKRIPSPQTFRHLPLTKREAEILLLITQGKSDGVIAALCGISPRTVHKHVENIYKKLGVETRTAAMLKALKSV